jgi:signal transduction histidine kinase
VRDHGPGLDATAQRRLFQPFSRSAQDAAGTAPGVGLGLALCARLARDMGGRLRWEPSVGSGTGFVLELPASEGRR